MLKGFKMKDVAQADPFENSNMKDCLLAIDRGDVETAIIALDRYGNDLADLSRKLGELIATSRVSMSTLPPRESPR
jgi:hypothetical protein